MWGTKFLNYVAGVAGYTDCTPFSSKRVTGSCSYGPQPWSAAPMGHQEREARADTAGVLYSLKMYYVTLND